MSEVQQSIFIISREDRAVDAMTVVAEGLRIGRLPDSHLWLNHPQVSRLHAGINRIGDDFYLVNLSASSATTLNGRVVPFNEVEAIVHGDEIQIGPFFLHIEELEQKLGIRVSSQYALNVGGHETAHRQETYQKQLRRDSGALRTPTGPLGLKRTEKSETQTALANALQVFWAKRTRDKAGRPSPLHPRKPPRLGKARFNWTPSRDLVRPWPFAIFVWVAVMIAAFAVLAAYAHKNAFAPDAVSNPHTRISPVITPVIATRASANSCTSCHAVGINVGNREKMNANCEACHNTEAFHATVISEHRTAGITCVSCHEEHHGAGFSPLNYALASCGSCHNDKNKTVYNGKTVQTPHGGTYGYPVKDGIWIWKGLDTEELAQKPTLASFLEKNRVNETHQDEWRNAQFHGIHLNSIRVVPGLEGVPDEAGSKILSCSSCHKTGYMGKTVDRSFPRTTCGKCHNAEVFNQQIASANRTETMSCTSCHVQHVKDLRWAASLRAKI